MGSARFETPEAHSRLLVRHALAVLRRYAEPRSGDQPGPEVQLALRVLAGLIDERHRHQLGTFWTIAQNPPGLPKRGNLLATLEQIERWLPPQLATPPTLD